MASLDSESSELNSKIKQIGMAVMARRIHLFPSRTQKLSLSEPKIVIQLKQDVANVFFVQKILEYELEKLKRKAKEKEFPFKHEIVDEYYRKYIEVNKKG